MDWDKAQKFEIRNYPWGKEYCPKTTAELMMVENDLYVRMTCYEKEPKRTYTEPDSPVYKDSCMEWFLSYDRSVGYLNLECNANGSLYAAFGPDRQHRFLLSEKNISMPSAKASIFPDHWSIIFHVPSACLDHLFPDRKGKKLVGNFYKCGDETIVPHFGCYGNIKLMNPDFHCPAFFVNLME